MNNITISILKDKTEKMAEAIYVASCASHMQNFDHSFDESTAKADMEYAKECAEYYCFKNRTYKPK